MTAIVPVQKPSSRIEIVDALRGSALMGLFLLHTVEHFDFLGYPSTAPAWLAALDRGANETARFLFAGKAYAIFAMMFGLSFFMIIDRAAQRGVDFRWRFLWRLAVLTAIGYAFGLIYCGEILTMLALFGLPLAALYRAPTRLLGWLSVLLLLQLPFWWQIVRLLHNPALTPAPSKVGGYYRALNHVFANDGFAEVIRANLWTGVKARWTWSIENGRYLQMFGLFIWGLLIGRSRVFEVPETCTRLARRALLWGGIAFAILYYTRLNLGTWGLPRPLGRVTGRLVASYCDLAQMVVWVSGFALLYHHTRARKLLKLLVPFGRMSLSCYVSQSVIGVVLFYNFGFGLYREWGIFYSILYGLAFFVGQCAAAHLWMAHFHYGPLEWLWRSCTLLSFKTPFRRRPAATTH